MRCVFLFLFLAWLNPLASQVRLGVEAGANRADVSSWQDARRWGPHAGVFAQFPERGRFSFRTGLQYGLKGLEQDEFYVRKDFLIQYDFHYLSAPVTASYRLFDEFRLTLGPVFSYLLSSRVTVGGKPVDLSQGGNSGFKHWDIGLQVGMSYSFNPGIGLYVRYENGFVDMANPDLVDERGRRLSHPSSSHNRVLQLGASYTFPLRRGQ